MSQFLNKKIKIESLNEDVIVKCRYISKLVFCDDFRRHLVSNKIDPFLFMLLNGFTYIPNRLDILIYNIITNYDVMLFIFYFY